MPLTFFSIAVILNLNNWIFYYFKIGEMASHIDPSAADLGNLEQIKRCSKILNFFTAFSVTCSFIFMFFVAYVSYQTNCDQSEMLTIVSGTTCIILSFSFGISGLLTNKRLKKYFNQFYQEHKCMLISSSLGLSIPLFIRGVTDLGTLCPYFDKWQD